MRRRIGLLAAALALGLGLTAAYGGGQPREALSPERQEAIIEAISHSLVRVEFALQYDKGQEPVLRGWGERCPNCGTFHGLWADKYVVQERPLELAGFLLPDGRILATDPQVHPRFVEGIAVQSGEGTVPARIAAYATESNALLIEAEGPLPGVVPLEFAPDAEGPFYTLTSGYINDVWQSSLQPLPQALTVTEDGRRFIAVPSNCLVVAPDGRVAGVSMDNELPPDGSWKGSPLHWRWMSAGEMAEALESLKAAAAESVVRVRLGFRSPRRAAEAGRRFRRWHSDERDATERNALGVLLGDGRVLVLANLDPEVTARLERITAYPPGREPVEADFAHTLDYYGALVATLREDLPGAARLWEGDLVGMQGHLLLSAEIQVHGEQRVAYFMHQRIPAFRRAWRRKIFPEIRGRGEVGFLFDAEASLLVLPLPLREKGAIRDRWRDDLAHPIPAAYIAEVMRDIEQHVAAHNIPLSEEEEGRTAWAGLELQPMTPELAQASGVSHLTDDGRTGAVVSFVYPDSPAERMGIEAGAVLLRIYAEGQPKPIDVFVDEIFDRDFPWERLDRIPVEYLEDLPPPWPPVVNPFTEALAAIGFGNTVRLEFFQGGEVLTQEFAIERGPAHYSTAPSFKSEPVGLTVRDLTSEVRHFFRLAPDAPGVIVSAVEPGGRAAVAGIRPFEIITSVNDQPPHSAKEFEELLAGRAELRLSVQRLTRTRNVRILVPE